MANEAENQKEDIHPDYRFLDYRLDQLELKLASGLEKIEADQHTYNTQVMQTLQTLQEGQSRTYESMAQIKERQDNMEQRLECIEGLKKTATKNTERIKDNDRNVTHRIDVVQRILFLVGGAAVTAFVTAIFTAVFTIL